MQTSPLLMRHKDANQSVTATLMRHSDANLALLMQSVKATWLGSAGAPQGCKTVRYGRLALGWALLVRHKDANQSVKATWLLGC